jgi:uncharacterized membrane protein YdjX (TVP38/TMEM64 family)
MVTKFEEVARPPPVQEQPVGPVDRRKFWFRIVGVLVLAVLVAVAWRWLPLRQLLDLDRMAAWMEPHRRAWYGLPIVILFFAVLGFLMVPVVIPVLATGLAFGPWLGSLYSLIGALTSATLAYALGRRIGPERMARLAGPKIGRISEKVKGHGPLAVFLLRKTPLPGTIVNVAIGAFGARFGDFLLGVILGVVPLVLALDAFEGNLTRVLEHATPGNVAVTVLFLVVPLFVAFRINRALKRSRMDASTPA